MATKKRVWKNSPLKRTNTNNLVQLKAYIPKTLKARLKRQREKEGRSISLILEEALKDYLKAVA